MPCSMGAAAICSAHSTDLIQLELDRFHFKKTVLRMLTISTRLSNWVAMNKFLGSIDGLVGMIGFSYYGK